MKIKKIIFAGLLALAVISSISVFTACKDNGNTGAAESGNYQKVQFEMENGDKFVVELYPEYAPETVENFIKLTKDGFFDGLTFHRIVDGFMAQGGWLDAEGNPREADTIKGEFSENGYSKNTLKRTKGVISMARADDPDSASSQFFIMLGDNSGLNGGYAAFGKVIEGMEVVEKFQEVERTINSLREIATPVNPVVIKAVTILD